MAGGTDCELGLAVGSSPTVKEAPQGAETLRLVRFFKPSPPYQSGYCPGVAAPQTAGVVASPPSSYECNHSNKQRRTNNGPDYWEVRSADLDGKEFR